MSRGKGLTFNAQISEEAAEWLVEFRTGDIDAAGRREFDIWIRRSPEHLRAFLETAAIWDASGLLDAQHQLDADLLRQIHAESNIVRRESSPIDIRSGAQAASPARWTALRSLQPRGLSRRLAMAASVIVLLAGGGLAWLQFSRAPTYSTAVGEQRTLTLSDGSTVELNSRSRIRVHFMEHERDIDLLDGQALFHVAKDRTRPFVVTSGGVRVRAVGTQFDVNRRLSGTVVTVLEGRVAVTTEASSVASPARHARTPLRAGADPDPTAASADAALVSAGEQITLTARAVPRKIRTNATAATAWTQHELVLDSEPLVDVAEEFNRYSTRKLVVTDSTAEPLRLSGVFATDTDFLLRYLRARSDITVRESDSEIYIERK